VDNREIAERRIFARLGLLNGVVIGLALAAGLWLPALWALAGVPTSLLPVAAVAAGAFLVLVICTLAGWISGRLQHTAASMLVWLAAGVLVTLVVAYRPYQFSTLLSWLLEPALYGRAVFPPSNASVAGIIISGLFLLLALAVLALLQQYRLEGLIGEWQPGERLTSAGWLQILLPGILLLAVGLLTGDIFGARATSQALQDTQRAIEVARTYEGDLFALGLAEGLNYAALRGVREQLGADYTLSLAESDPEMGQTVITARFENGAWINCRLIHEQLTFCEDASAPYTLGFASLISGGQPPCDDCRPQAGDAWASWLAERREILGPEPQIDFVRQRGAHVLMQASAPDGAPGGGRAIRCWFEGVDPVRLLSCQEVRS